MIASLMKTWWDTANGGKCNDLLCTSHLVIVTRKGISSCMKMHHVLTYIANDSSCDFKGKKKNAFWNHLLLQCCNVRAPSLITRTVAVQRISNDWATWLCREAASHSATEGTVEFYMLQGVRTHRSEDANDTKPSICNNYNNDNICIVYT